MSYKYRQLLKNCNLFYYEKYKKINKSHLFCTYRTISLLLSLSKIFERIIYSRKIEYCTEIKMMSNAFRL